MGYPDTPQEQTLPFKVHSNNGGCNYASYNVENCLSDYPHSAYCTARNKNCDVVLEYDTAGSPLIKTLIAMAPTGGFTAPLRYAIAFLSEKAPSSELMETRNQYDNLTQDAFEGIAQDETSEDKPVAFFSLERREPKNRMEVHLPNPRIARYVHCKLITAWTDENIDVSYVGARGHLAVSVPLV